MMPPSTATSRPSASTNRFPGCMSAWKKPSRIACFRKDWMILRASSGRSWPAARRPSTSERRTPSIHSSTSISRAVSCQSGSGTRKSASSFVFSANSERAAASSRRSISIATERARVSTTPVKRRRRASAERASAVSAPKRIAARSRLKRSRMPGRRILTATSRPSFSRARWTWAIEAAATGSLNSTKIASSFSSCAASTMARASAIEKAGIRSCRADRSSAIFMPTTSGRVARNWPNLT
ncbi:hypothetical protein BTHI11S_00858 [Bosea thiooxidans]